MAAPEPVSALEFSRQCHGCDTSIAVAISGGADSMALLLLLEEWTRARKIKLHALSVDHGLRTASADECKQVARWCKELGVAHSTLKWSHDGIKSAVQQRAREARYGLMLDWCRAHGIRHLFTAHHLDDQVETFLLRLLRKSNLEGLAGILPVSDRAGIFLHRPLLSFPKSRLLATLGSRSQEHISDPSNDDVRYARNALRPALTTLDNTTKERVSQLTVFFQKFRNHLEYKLSQSLADCFALNPAGYGELAIRPYLNQPEVMRERMAQYICMLVAGNANPLRSDQVATLASALSSPAHNQKTMLHGVMFHYLAKRGTWVVSREQKHASPALALLPKTQLWDGRFEVSAARVGYVVAPLGNHTARFAEVLVKLDIPKPAWRAIAAIFHLEECVAVPHIDWQDPRHKDSRVQVAFVCSKRLAAAREEVMRLKNKSFKGERARA